MKITCDSKPLNLWPGFQDSHKVALMLSVESSVIYEMLNLLTLHLRK